MENTATTTRQKAFMRPVDYNGSSIEARRRQKRVHSACERCRNRRIKCDAQMPACGNCTKSGSVCIDVDGQNDERRISRSYVEDATARIAWLEDIIRTQLPHVNLGSSPASSRGPVVDASYLCQETALLSDDSSSSPNALTPELPLLEAHSAQSVDQPPPPETQGVKRVLPSIERDGSSRASSLEQDTRSVALGLGFLTLNSDSRQLHYLGSSSGSLLASLATSARASSHGEPSPPSSVTEHSPEMEDPMRASHNVRFDVLRTSIHGLYRQLGQTLPPRKDCRVLCDQYFSQLHPNHPFLHRPSFDWMVDALYMCAATTPPFRLQHNGWPENVGTFDCNGEEHVAGGRKQIPVPVHVAAFQVFLVLSIGATLQVRRRIYHHDPETLSKSAMSLSQHLFNSITLPSLQALLILLVHSLVGPSGYDLWTLSRLAMAYAVDIGIHRETGDRLKLSPLAVEMRRRIFFSVYSFDRSISTVQGRPFCLSDGFYDVHLPSVVLGDGPLDEMHDRCLGYSVHVFKINEWVSRIKTLFYRLSQPPDGTPWATDVAAAQKALHNSLEQWVAEVPAVVRSAPSDLKLRLTTKLQIHFHSTMCLLHQPSQAIVQPDDASLLICYRHAAQRLGLYETLYESGSLVHSWRTVHDIFLAGTTVLYCVWISEAVRATVSLPALSSICRRCSSLLSVGGEWWPVIRKSKLSLERLASHTMEMFAERQPKASESTTNTTAPAEVSSPQLSEPIILPDQAGQGPDWLPEQIEEALTSVLNHDHDGQLSQILEMPTQAVLWEDVPDDLNSFTGSRNFSDDFWVNLDTYLPYSI